MGSNMGGMGSGTGAKVLLVVGFLAAWIGYDAWIVSHAVLDPAATRAAAEALFRTPTVRRALADQLTAEIDQRFPSLAGNPSVAPIVATTLRDPRVQAAFGDTIVEIHKEILAGGARNTFTIDTRALSPALRDALAPRYPQLAARITKVPPFALRIRNNNLPNVHDPRGTTNGVALLASIAALLLIAAALLLRHDRRTIARVGRRVAYLATTPFVIFFVLPRVLEHASGEAPQIAATLLRVYGDRVLPSAIALVVAGGLIALGALLWPRHLFDDQPGIPSSSSFPGAATGRPDPTGRLSL